ncbi:MAG: globin domain-containing protein [Gammaproteobacteria bacterium]|nr:globin domain-containing protein [Gammaproteobacteria bacterium]
MTPEHIDLVKHSWNLIDSHAVEMSDIFYNRLFETNPEFRPLFSTDIQMQGKALMETLNIVINGMDDFEELLPGIRALGTKHTSYGVKKEDYEPVADALIYTLKNIIGQEFTPEIEQAWINVYEFIADTMHG